MKKLILLMLVSVVTLLISSSSSQAQTRYVLEGEQELAVLGTSTIHSWEMVTYEATGEGQFWLEEGRLIKVEGLIISIVASNLESGKGRIMDRNARRALKVEENPNITFQLQEITVDEEGQSWANGNLTAAGFTKPMTFKIEYTIQRDKLDIRTKASFKLTDFEIEPPVALAGTLRTGDAVSLDVVLSFKKQ